MIRLTALNDDTSRSSEEDDIHPKEPSLEIQEENSLKLYNEALQEQRGGNIDKAEEMYKQLLASNLLMRVKPDEETLKNRKPDNICSIYAKPALMLKYSCLKNLAVISKKKNLLSKALDYYTRALEVEGTDVTMWYQSGCIAMKLFSITTALEAFLKGLEFSPKHWPSLDNLIICLFTLHDYVTCLHFISRAFELDVNYTRGQVLRDYIFSEQPSLQTDIKHFFPNINLHVNEKNGEKEEIKDRLLKEVLKIRNEYSEKCKAEMHKEKVIDGFSSTKGVETPSWSSLGQNILQIHDELTNQEERISLLTPISLNKAFPDIQTTVVNDNDVIYDIKEPKENPTVVDSNEEKNQKEKPEDGGDKKSKRNRGSALMEELLWGGKRRSARVRSSLRGNPEPMDVAEALRRILPRKLLHKTKQFKVETSCKNIEEDSMDTMDLYRLFEKQESAEEKRQKEEQERSEVEHDIDKIVESEGYFGKKKEALDIVSFMDSENGKNIIEIVESFVKTLAGHWNKTWPNVLPIIFIKCYQLMRKFHPMDFKMCTTQSNFKKLVEESDSVILYGELCLEHSTVKRGKNSFDSKVNTKFEIISLQNIMELIDRGDMFETEEKYFEFLVRLYWLRCRIFLEKSQTNLAIVALNDVLACYELHPQFQSNILYLKNCRKHNVISQTITEEFLAYQSRKRSLAEVVRLYEDESYQELTEILKETFTTTPDTVSNYFKEQESELVDRQTQLSMLINGLYHLNEYKECIYWLETCCHEVLQKSNILLLPGEEEGESWMITFDRFLVAIEDCLNLGKTTITDALPPNRVSRFVQTLCHAICKELEDSDRPPCPARPWIMLNTILIGLEEQGKPDTNSEEDEEDENDIPSSILILFTAHEYLGRREWCNCNESILLFSIMDQVIPHIRNPDWSSFRETIQQHLEQVIYCLYSHPNKKAKARYLTDHNVNCIPLTWQRGIQLFDLFRPDEIPSFDSLRVNLISSDTEVLFRRIAALIPDDMDPAQISDKMTDFIVGKKNDVPTTNVRFPEAVQDIFYILGDYYFKTHEFTKAVNYLLMDLCANPTRVDSWASMALSRASVLEQQLNSCDPLKDEVFLQDALAALRCYEHCLQLDHKQCALWIEYGSFIYTIHSFCSQRMKLESDSLSLEQFEELESTKNKMLNTAKQAFVNANLIWYEVKEDLERQDERWLHHYMLGKICEKNGDLSYFEHYEKAAELLYENEAEFPSKVGYTTPQTLAIEALEVFYRTHVCVIKALELNEGKPLDSKTRQLFSKHLDICSKGPFAKQMSKGDLAKQKAKQLEAAHQEKQMKIFKGILNDIISKIESENEKDDEKPALKKESSVEIEIIEVDDIKDKPPKVVTEEEKPNLEVIKKEETIKTESKSESDNEVMIIDEKLDDSGKVKEVVKENVVEQSRSILKKPEIKAVDVKSKLPTTPQNVNYGDFYQYREGGADNHYVTLEDLKNIPQPVPKQKKKRRSSQAMSSSSCESEEIRYADDSSSSSSSSESSGSSRSSSSSSSDSSQSDTSNKDGKASDDEEKQSESDKESNSEKSSAAENKDSDDSENHLLKRCLFAFETCALRFPQHYKSVYRLAHFYFRSKEHRDITKCRDLLLGRYQTPNGTISGLFAERKSTNFFNGIWRIPAGDVDRPGSFASHMSRSVLLLMEVLRDLKDHKMLLEICLQLWKTPEPDKKYLREGERNQLSVQACNLTIQTLRKNVKDSSVMTLPIVLDCYRCYQKIQKHYPHKEGVFGDILLEAFKRLGKGDKCSLEQALRFCHSEVSTVKPKVPQGLLTSHSSISKPRPLKLKKQEKKKSTRKPQLSAKTVQKVQKPKKPMEGKKKLPLNIPRPSIIGDTQYWSALPKVNMEPKIDFLKSGSPGGSQIWRPCIPPQQKQKDQIEKKSFDQNAVKLIQEQSKSEIIQKMNQEPGKYNQSIFQQGYDLEKTFLSMWENRWSDNPFAGNKYSEIQVVKKNRIKMTTPRSVLKANIQKPENASTTTTEELVKTKTNFNIEDILGKGTKINKGQSSSNLTLSKSIEEKIKSISGEVNVTKCSSQALNLSAARKNAIDATKRSSSDTFGEATTIKKICRPQEPPPLPKKDEIEVVVIDD